MHKFYKRLYEEIGEDKNLLEELISDFITIYQDHIEQLTSSINNAAYEDIAFIAHKLKGSSMNFNMPRFTQAAQTLEDIGKGQLDRDMTTPFEIMENEFEAFANAKDEL